MITHEFHKTKVKIINFFNKIKTINNITKINIKDFITLLIIFHQMMKIFMTKIKDSTLITYINQIFLNHIHKNNIRGNLDQITHLKIMIFTHKFQLIQIIINQPKCKMKSHYLITYDNMRSQKVNLQIFHKCQMPQNHFK